MAVRSATLQPMQLLVHGGDDNDDDEEDGNRHQHHHGHKRVISITMAMMMVLLLIYLFCKQDHDLIHRSSLLPPLSPINKKSHQALVRVAIILYHGYCCLCRMVWVC